MKRFFALSLMVLALIACTEENHSEDNPTIIKLEKSNIELDAFNLTSSVKLYTSHDWTVRVEYGGLGEGWLAVEPMSGSAGDAEIVIKTLPNFDPLYRRPTAKINIYAGYLRKTIEVTQEHFETTMKQMTDPTYSSTDFSQNGTVETMQTASVGAGINIVFMGDGFTDRLIDDGTYHKIMHLAQESFFSLEPYKSFRDHFTCRYINVVSKDEMIAQGHNTALGVEYGQYGIDSDTVIKYLREYANVNDLDNTLAIVVANLFGLYGFCTTYYPEVPNSYGSGFTIATVGLTNFQNVMTHECGHGFAKLADEYVIHNDDHAPQEVVDALQIYDHPIGWWKNIDVTNNPDEIIWSKFLSDPRYDRDYIGIYEGAWSYGHGVYRPTTNSRMRPTDAEYNVFNAPSREAIYYRIHKLAFGDEWEYDYEKFVEYDQKNIGIKQDFPSISLLHCAENPTHQPPIVYNHSWREAIEQ